MIYESSFIDNNVFAQAHHYALAGENPSFYMLYYLIGSSLSLFGYENTRLC